MSVRGYYTYLVSTLPALQFGMKPPFSFEKFLRIASCHLSDEDIGILKEASISGEHASEKVSHPTLTAWRSFDSGIRNELVKLRSHHLKSADPSKFIRGDGIDCANVHHIVASAHRNPSPLDAEATLDRARWDALDELETGHYFDLDILIIYAHKILILERWNTVNTADKDRLLEESVWQGRGQAA